MDNFCAAWRFLTIIPLPGKYGTSETALRQALPHFISVGIVLGLALGLLAYSLSILTSPVDIQVSGFTIASTPTLTTDNSAIFPKLLAFCPYILVFLLAAISGALHLDGLADSADGLFSARKKDKMLEIMRDSRIGVMGVLGLILILSLKVEALRIIPTIYWGLVLFWTVFASRSLILIHIICLPYLRKEGLGTIWKDYKQGRILLLGMGLVWVFLISATYYIADKYELPGAADLLVQLALLLIFLVLLSCFLAWYLKHRLGGATGDTYGAVIELTETFVLVYFSLLWYF